MKKFKVHTREIIKDSIFKGQLTVQAECSYCHKKLEFVIWDDYYGSVDCDCGNKVEGVVRLYATENYNDCLKNKKEKSQ